MKNEEGETYNLKIVKNTRPIAQGALVDLALHTLGWKAVQDLCAQVFEEVLNIPVSIYCEAQDGGQDAVFIFEKQNRVAKRGTIQCKFTSDAKRRLKSSDLTREKDSVRVLAKNGDADTYYFITNMGIDAPVAAMLMPLNLTFTSQIMLVEH